MSCEIDFKRMKSTLYFFNQLKAGSRFELRDGPKETSLSLRREVRSFEILIPDPFVSRGEEVYNTIALKLPLQEFYAFQISELS